MIIRTLADPAEGARAGRRLNRMLTGERATITHADDPATERRMIMLGLIDGVELEIETRGRGGDLIVIAEGDRYHIPARFAENIWVVPGEYR